MVSTMVMLLLLWKHRVVKEGKDVASSHQQEKKESEVAQSCPTVAYKAPLSMEFSRQEYWSGLPFPFPGDLPDPGIEPRSPALQADALLSEPPERPLYTYT